MNFEFPNKSGSENISFTFIYFATFVRPFVVVSRVTTIFLW